MAYQPRYAAYLRAKGYQSQEQQKEADGGMAEYMVWINQQISAFRKEIGLKRDQFLNDRQHGEFTAYLERLSMTGAA